MKPTRSGYTREENARVSSGFFIGLLFGIVLQIIFGWFGWIIPGTLLIVFSLIMISYTGGIIQRSKRA